jgi:hypothetical protein
MVVADTGDELPVLPGRLQRLADELAEEGVPALRGAPDVVAALVELAYALRPKLHERRVPSYGVILPDGPLKAGRIDHVADVALGLIPTADLDLQFARRFADGVSTFAVRDADGISDIAAFSRNMADEYDLVGLQAALGGLIIQRHPGGQVRVFGPQGVVRWNGITWHHDAPIDAWIDRLGQVATDMPVDGIRPLLRFAIHELGGRRIGATLIWTPCGDRTAHTEQLVHSVPSLHVADTGEEAAIANALSQTDGAAIFDADCYLRAIGVRLAPSTDAEHRVGAMRGMRHTSALRYSFDDPDAILLVVSESGPVTLMHAGKAITTVDPGAETIG